MNLETVVIACVALAAFVVCTMALLVTLRARRDLREAIAERLPEPTSASTLGQDRLLAALQAIDEAIVIVDAEGREVLRNPQAARFREPMSGDTLVLESMQQLLDEARTGQGGSEELTLFGSPSRTVAVHAVPLQVGAQRVGAMAWARDISESRRTDQVRRDFVANVSHELKTPIGALTVLAETMAVADDALVQQQLADRVVREADRLAQIVEDLLDLSLLEAQESPNRETLPAALIVSDAIDQVHTKADAQGIPVMITALESDVYVTGDRRQLTSAVTNLIDNAVKYSDRGSIVEVALTSVHGELRIGVRDHGVGIPARDLERVFERFYRVDRARSRATGGTGLGLSIVRHVVQAHGGEVTVESTEGVGSEFCIRIPQAGTASTATREREGISQ